MSLIDFWYGGKKSSDVPFWVFSAKLEEQNEKRKIEEEKEYKRREYEEKMKDKMRLTKIKNEFENAYINEVIRQVEEKIARDKYCNDHDEF